jgi:hypothetical protein
MHPYYMNKGFNILDYPNAKNTMMNASAYLAIIHQARKIKKIYILHKRIYK